MKSSRGLPSRALDGVRVFFFGTTTGEAGALFRMGFGALLTWYFVVLIGWNLDRYYGEGGVFPFAAFQESGGGLTVLALSKSPALLWGTWVVSLLAALAFAAGFHARVAAALVYVGVLSFQNRNPFIVNGAERLLLPLSFLAIFAPLSLRWAVSERGKEAGRKATVFGLALIRMQIVIVYTATFFLKVKEPIWRSGGAISKALDAPTMSRVVGGLGSEGLERALTYGTLVVEALFFLVLWRRFRPWVLVAGVLLHLSIEALMIVTIFSATMLVSYLALLGDEDVKAILRRLRKLRGASRD